MFLHVGPPTIRLLPVELLLSDNRKPQVRTKKIEDLTVYRDGLIVISLFVNYELDCLGVSTQIV